MAGGPGSGGVQVAESGIFRERTAGVQHAQAEAEKEIIPCCQAYRLGILPYHPLDSGFLTGKYRRAEPAPEGTRFFFAPQIAEAMLTDARFDLLERLVSFAAESGHSILELAIGWLLARPMVSCVIIAASGTGQVKANVRASTWRLSRRDMQVLNGILGGPHSQADERWGVQRGKPSLPGV